MTVCDIQTSPKGVIIGGVNPEFDTMQPDEIKNIIGQTIEIHNPDGSVLQSTVRGVEMTSSLIEKKNIFILLQDGIHRGAVQQEALVYSIG
jgi:hypothetical protein